jgi:OTU domain-containing protein 5
VDGVREHGSQDTVLSSSMQMVLSMGFSYLQVIEAYSIFGDDVDSMVCYLLETGSSSRRKGKATE